MAEISISRALVELKTLGDRIERAIGDINPNAYKINNKLSINNKTETEFTDEAKAALRKAQDLIERRNKVKAAVIASNAKTHVSIGGERMTVAEAIERKTSIEFEQTLIKVLAVKFDAVDRKIALLNEKMEDRLDALLKETFKKDSSKVKDDEYRNVATPFRTANEVTMVDPLNIEKLLQKKQEELTLFMQEVDIVLTESNATIRIEV